MMHRTHAPPPTGATCSPSTPPQQRATSSTDGEVDATTTVPRLALPHRCLASGAMACSCQDRLTGDLTPWRAMCRSADGGQGVD